jgi:hypothetical protein
MTIDPCAAPIGALLRTLESAAPILRADPVGAVPLLEQASRALEGRSLDSLDRLILGQVLGRLRRAAARSLPELGAIEARVGVA